MFEPANVRAAVPAFDPVPETRPVEDLTGVLPPLRPIEDNDNAPAVAPRIGERRGFEVPAAIWVAMVTCYGVFLASLLAATGGARAGFAIAISAVYVAMFFGAARAMLRQQPPQLDSPLARRGGVLQTLYGPLGRSEVAVQMLVVPIAICLFAFSVLVIRLAVA